MKLSNKTYDILKKVSMLMIPLGTFIAALVDIFGIPYGIEICATISAFGIFLGKFLEISSKEYFADKEEVDDDNDAEDTQGVG